MLFCWIPGVPPQKVQNLKQCPKGYLVLLFVMLPVIGVITSSRTPFSCISPSLPVSEDSQEKPERSPAPWLGDWALLLIRSEKTGGKRLPLFCIGIRRPATQTQMSDWEREEMLETCVLESCIASLWRGLRNGVSNVCVHAGAGASYLLTCQSCTEGDLAADLLCYCLPA